jgi:hypothetical protein
MLKFLEGCHGNGLRGDIQRIILGDNTVSRRASSEAEGCFLMVLWCCMELFNWAAVLQWRE